MLSCQIITENPNMFICKKLKERTFFNNVTMTDRQCQQCQKLGEEKYLDNVERFFYINFLFSEKKTFINSNYEEIYKKALIYYNNKKNNINFIFQIKQRILYFILNPRIDFDKNFKNILLYGIGYCPPI